jgi:hypothetical protein
MKSAPCADALGLEQCDASALKQNVPEAGAVACVVLRVCDAGGTIMRLLGD